MQKRMKLKTIIVVTIVSILALSNLIPLYADETSETRMKIQERNVQVIWDGNQNEVDANTARLSDEKVTSGEQAIALLVSKKKDLNDEKILETYDRTSYKFDRKSVDYSGNTYYIIETTIDDVAIYGTKTVVICNKDGYAYKITGDMSVKLPPGLWSSNYVFTAGNAILKALEDVKLDEISSEINKNTTVDKFIYENEGIYYSSFIVDVEYENEGLDVWRYFIDASRGKVIEKHLLTEKNIKDKQLEFDDKVVSLKSNEEDINGWIYNDTIIESEHNYKSNSIYKQNIKNENARDIALYFEKIQLEKNVDFLIIKNDSGDIIEKITGKIDSKSVIINGNEATIELITSSKVNDYGYKVSRVAYYYDDKKEFVESIYDEKHDLKLIKLEESIAIETEDSVKKEDEKKEESKRVNKKTQRESGSHDLKLVEESREEYYNDESVKIKNIVYNLTYDGNYVKGQSGRMCGELVESKHEYDNNTISEYVIKKEGASHIIIYFGKIEIEEDSDFLYVLDKDDNIVRTLKNQREVQYIRVRGDVAKIKFVTDADFSGFGFRTYLITYRE